jgi:hypothetical protein
VQLDVADEREGRAAIRMLSQRGLGGLARGVELPSFDRFEALEERAHLVVGLGERGRRDQRQRDGEEGSHFTSSS